MTVYNRWTRGPKHRLRFSKTGDPNLEEAYARHYVRGTRKSLDPPPPEIPAQED